MIDSFNQTMNKMMDTMNQMMTSMMNTMNQMMSSMFGGMGGGMPDMGGMMPGGMGGGMPDMGGMMPGGMGGGMPDKGGMMPGMGGAGAAGGKPDIVDTSKLKTDDASYRSAVDKIANKISDPKLKAAFKTAADYVDKASKEDKSGDNSGEKTKASKELCDRYKDYMIRNADKIKIHSASDSEMPTAGYAPGQNDIAVGNSFKNSQSLQDLTGVLLHELGHGVGDNSNGTGANEVRGETMNEAYRDSLGIGRHSSARSMLASLNQHQRNQNNGQEDEENLRRYIA